MVCPLKFGKKNCTKIVYSTKKETHIFFFQFANNFESKEVDPIDFFSLNTCNLHTQLYWPLSHSINPSRLTNQVYTKGVWHDFL